MKLSLLIYVSLIAVSIVFSQEKPDWQGNVPDGCTTITVGKKASSDGSVMTSHTDDSHRTRSEINIVPEKKHTAGSKATMYKRVACDTTIMPTYSNISIGEIPQIETTYGFINSAYPCMNQKQLAIGESTFGGRPSLKSDNGLIDCQRLCQLMLERCSTAREAIKLADELTKKHGWIDDGECLTIADKKEVWHFEIVGPGKNNKGAIWVAQRVPDDHVSVNANGSTIRQIDLKNPDYYMASENIYTMAKDSGWWNPQNGPFEFVYAYSPESRTSIAVRRREWRVFDLFAPSLKLDPNAECYPFSVKPDIAVTLEKMVEVFKDYYEGTPYDMTRNITSADKDGKTIVSPLANPFMPYDQLGLHNVNGSWFYVDEKSGKIQFYGERTIARWYTMYATITQSRDWLPDNVGGVVWLALDNVASSIYIPVYCSVSDLPESYKYPGRKGYTTKSAWWAFNRLSTLSAQRWGDMRKDVDAVFVPWQKELIANQSGFEKAILNIKDKNTQNLKLTEYTMLWGNKVVSKAWELGDFLWTKYDEKF
jgi:dipeptidase